MDDNYDYSEVEADDESSKDAEMHFRWQRYVMDLEVNLQSRCIHLTPNKIKITSFMHPIYNQIQIFSLDAKGETELFNSRGK